MTGCRKFVEIPPPTTSLVKESVFSKNSTATAAQLALYAEMQSNAPLRIMQTGLLSDEFTNYATATTAKDCYTNALSVTLDASALGWNTFYTYIYQINAILEGLSASSGVTPSVKKQLIGESKFLRAYYFLYLASLYGDAPLTLSTDYAVNVKLPRNSRQEVLQQVITDLKEAQASLNSIYVDATDTVASSERIRPNKGAATALLARAYLYTGNNWSDAEAQATAVIANTSLYVLESNLNNVFLIAASTAPHEAIWQLQPNVKTNYTPEGSALILNYNPATTGGSYRQTISPQLLSVFEAGDARRANWIGSYTSTNAPIATYLFPYKYKFTTTSSKLTEYSMMLRLAEQYLIRAEARAQQNKLPDAIADLNLIRARASLSPLSNALSQTQVLAAVAQERRVELFAESHRWVDLKRTNTVDAVMTLVTPQKGGTWQSYQQWFPITQADINNSGGILVQTNGYN